MEHQVPLNSADELSTPTDLPQEASVLHQPTGDTEKAAVMTPELPIPAQAKSVPAPSQEIEADEKGHRTTSLPSLGSHRSSNGFLDAVSRLGYTPKRCRWDPEKPPPFGWGLNLLFAFGATFSVANLYYNHPILNVLAADFGVSYERVSVIPTVMQAGYATGLLFLCPLGDVVHRRRFILILTWFTATMWLALCLTSNFIAFVVLSFITSITTVTPQLLLPMVADVAPPARRAHALSIVVSGLLAGILVARLLSGILTEYSSWRSVYWFSFGVQYLIVVLLYLFLPDAPPSQPKQSKVKYPTLLFSTFRLLAAHPVLIQSCTTGLLISATFTSYWTVLTALLSAPPYSYSSLVIGLFALVGLFAMFLGPTFSSFLLNRLQPLHALLLSEMICLTGVLIGTFLGKLSVAAPILQAFAIDLGLQTSQVANRTAIYKAAPERKSGVNTVFMLAVFVGQLTGTAVGNALYAAGEASGGMGWRWSGAVGAGFVGGAIAACALRGPWETGWMGWRGGWGRKSNTPTETDDSEAQKMG